MQISEQTKTNLRSYDSLTQRGQARRLRELAKSALPYENFMARCEAVFRGYRQVLPLRSEWIEYLPTFMASRTASYILHVAADPKAVESQWRSLLRPLLKATLNQFPS